jgi:hypothetical protein
VIVGGHPITQHLVRLVMLIAGLLSDGGATIMAGIFLVLTLLASL